MPEMTGTEATRAIRAAGYAGFILGMTGDPVGSQDRADFECCGTDRVVDKEQAAMRFVTKLILERAALRRERAQSGGRGGSVDLSTAMANPPVKPRG